MPGLITAHGANSDQARAEQRQRHIGRLGHGGDIQTPAGQGRLTATGKHVIVSRGPWPSEQLPDAVEILFDDGSDNPFALHLSPESLDRMPLDTDAGKEWLFTVWTAPRRNGPPHKALERPAYYRRVDALPCLLPL